MPAIEQISIRKENMAKLSCAIAGMLWGVFWIPLRAIDGLGVSPGWALVLFYGIPMIIVLPLIILRWRLVLAAGWRLQLVGFIVATALMLYSLGFLYTEVVRAVVLFYTTPIWSTLLARIILKDAITPIRVIAIILGIFGMLVIFGINDGVPLPQNLGDWVALSSGFVWAIAAVMMRMNQGLNAIDLTASYSTWALAWAFVLVLLPGVQVMPDLALIVDSLYWLIPVLLMVVLPAGFTMMWGTPLLSPGVTAMLFMTEISVGTITAAIWANEPFGAQEITGIILVSLAGLLEVLVGPFRKLLPSKA